MTKDPCDPMTKITRYRIYCCLLITLLIVGSVVVGHPWSRSHAESTVPEVPQLAGWVLKGLNWDYTPPVWETESVIQSMREHGVNAIRRHFASAPLMEQGAINRTEYFRRWHTVATWCAENGMWVIYDFYGRFIGKGKSSEGMRWVWEMPEADFLELWRVIAREMKAHGNVLLQLGNEPNDVGETDPSHRDIWLQRCVKAIEIIRQEGFHGYIIIPIPEAASWAWPVFPYRQQVDDADPLDRYMWSFHYYWYHHEYQVGSPDDYTLEAIQGWLDVKGITALRDTGDRVICTESGVQGQNYDPRDLQWFQNLQIIFNRDNYDRICEAYQPDYNFPQLAGTKETTDWYTLNTQGNAYVAALPPDLSYYTYPPIGEEPPPPVNYPREGANKRSPGIDLEKENMTSSAYTIPLIRVDL